VAVAKRKNTLGLIVLSLAIVLLAVAGWVYISDRNTAYAQQLAWTLLSDEFTETTERGRIIDFDALRAINPDVVAWIYIPGTLVDYPVVQTSNNTFYLNRNFERNWCRAGSIYLDAAAASDFTDVDTYIFGHHLRSGAMFGSLVMFRDSDFAEEHSVIYVFTPESTKTYTVVDSGLIHATETIEVPEFDVDDYFITLVTCEYDFDDARYWVRAILNESRSRTGGMTTSERSDHE